MNSSSSFGLFNASFTWPLASDVDDNPSADEETPLLGNDAEAPPPSPSSLFRLQDLTINFHEAGLNVICGPSGSGQSSLLLALLGEMHLDQGYVSFPQWQPPTDVDTAATTTIFTDDVFPMTEHTAYCPQTPWILNKSIRTNIILDHPFNASRYAAVLRAVALDADLLANNTNSDKDDEALAGENGNRLSCGQKQKVSLARALYSPCRYVLLDDCLSALDARTARRVLSDGIKGPLMEGRTYVLATHPQHTRLVVPHADLVVMLEGGRVKGVGSPGDLIAKGLVDEQTAKGKLVENSDSVDETSRESPDPAQGSNGRERTARAKTDATNKDKAEGALSWAVVRGYLNTMGPAHFWVLVIIGFTAQQVVALGTILWIREWAFQYDKPASSQGQQQRQEHRLVVSAWYYLAIYAALCLGYALITFLRDFITFSGAIKASSHIYERLLDAVLSAKLSFFDSRPLGQITSRFSQDISVVDQSLASFSVGALQIATTVAMVVIVMVCVLPGEPFLLLVLALMFAGYYLVTTIYIRAAKDLKRIEADARPPLCQHAGESIAGYVSIRAYGRQASFSATNSHLVDGLHQPYLLLEAAKQWLKVRTDILSSVITFVAGVLVVWGGGGGPIDPGAAGLVLTYAVTLPENMRWLVALCATVRQDLSTVERISEYTTATPESKGAAPGRLLSSDAPEAWPTQGAVVFRHFSARYAPHHEEPVLRDVSLAVRPGERVAVVGRPGAGKTSLALALLRALEADESNGGNIEIDGVDIATVELARLRGAAVTLIPQEPQLLEGSVRANLDPLGRHTDQELREVLLRCTRAPAQAQAQA